MKKFILIVTVVLMVLMATPKLIGNFAKQSYYDSFSHLPDNINIQVEQLSYKASWFSSTATTALTLNTGIPQIDNIRWIITSKIYHGPILSGKNGMQFGLSYVEATTTTETLQSNSNALQPLFPKNFIAFTSLVGFDKIRHDTIQLAPLEYRGNEVSLNFEGLIIKSHSDLAQNTISGNMKLYPVMFAGQTGALMLSESQGSFQLHKYNKDIYLGGYDFTVQSFTTKNFKMNNIHITSSTQFIEQHIHNNISINTHNIQALLPITSFDYNAEVILTPETFLSWLHLSKQLATHPNDSMETAEYLNSDTFKGEFTSLIQHKITFNQDMSIHGWDGEFKADFAINFHGISTSIAGLTPSEQRLTLLKSIEANIALQADKEAMLQSPLAALVEPNIQRGVIIEDGNQYKATIVLSHGEMKLNHIIIPIQDMVVSNQSNQPPKVMIPKP